MTFEEYSKTVDDMAEAQKEFLTKWTEDLIALTKEALNSGIEEDLILSKMLVTQKRMEEFKEDLGK